MPFGEDILRYQDKYHALSNDRIPYRRDKTETACVSGINAGADL